jgi:hypothetical protein
MRIIEAYISTTGNLYLDKESCAAEDGLVKCKICSGKGQEKYEHIEIIPYPSGRPDSGWVEPKRIITPKTRECTRCLGLGYVQENIEDNEEYQKYLELKNKFKNKE